MYIAGMNKDLTKLLETLIKFKSTNDNIIEQQNIAQFLRKYLLDLGFNVNEIPLYDNCNQPDFIDYNAESNICGQSVEDIKNRDSFRKIIYAYNGDAQDSSHIMFYAHYDVVGDFGWREAFEPYTVGNLMYGRGTNDMKGGIAGILLALKNYTEHTGRTPPVKVVFVPDEEDWSKAAWILVNQYFEIFSGISLIVVPETGDFEGKESEQIQIVRGRRGRIVFDMKLKGISSHGATPFVGINPIYRLPEVIDKIRTNVPLYYDAEAGIFDTMSILDIKSTSSNLSIPDLVNLRIDLHYTNERLRQLCNNNIELINNSDYHLLSHFMLNFSMMDGIDIEIFKRPTPYPPIWIEKINNTQMIKVSTIINECTGSYPDYVVARSVADENILSLVKIDNYPIIINICPYGKNCHGNNEWIDLQSLEKIVNIFELIIKKY